MTTGAFRSAEGAETVRRLYRKVLDTAGDRPVVFRTLDIGGDKVLPYLEAEREENPALGRRAIRLEIVEPEKPLWVQCDDGQFENAVLNLVLNSRDAIRASGHGSTITVRVRALDGMSSRQLGRPGPDGGARDFVEFSVSDDGPGMSAEVRRRATDPFFTTKGQQDGTGLGLSVVYGFVEQSGGVLKIYSEVGRGTTVRLILPRGSAEGAAPRRSTDQPVTPGAGEHILVVDDQPDLLAITRDIGQDTQRAFARAQWDLRRVTGMGQVVTLTGMVRGDVYHSDENFLTQTPSYRGNPGWEYRGVALGAVDVQWPFVGEAFGGTQVFTPRVQFVATPPIRNLAIPNEDARAIDLEDSNLFALNRFPGYDRVEDGARVTYGFDWSLRVPDWEFKTTVGQSYRLDNDRDILPEGTGLSEKFSDFVGRTEVRYKDFVKFTHRFRLDKDSLAIRRNEIDATVGSSKTYAELGYVRLNRDITQVEDLQDREELRGAVRVAFANYWSIFGSGVFNLTDREEDPTFDSDGFDPIRTRLGVAYQDDCLEIGVTWRRDYISSGDAERGDTFQFYFSLRNLGFR